MAVSFTGSSVVERGIRISKELPSPGRLDTEISPLSRLTSPRVIARPSPNPSASTSGAARSKGWNIRSTVFSSMPMPVSCMRTVRISFSYMAERVTEPDFVNLIAFDNRLSKICSMRSASPETVMSGTLMSLEKSSPLSLAGRVYSSAILSRKGMSLNGTGFRVSLASFMRDKSSRLLARRMMWREASRMFSK